MTEWLNQKWETILKILSCTFRRGEFGWTNPNHMGTSWVGPSQPYTRRSKAAWHVEKPHLPLVKRYQSLSLHQKSPLTMKVVLSQSITLLENQRLPLPVIQRKHLLSRKRHGMKQLMANLIMECRFFVTKKSLWKKPGTKVAFLQMNWWWKKLSPGVVLNAWNLTFKSQLDPRIRGLKNPQKSPYLETPKD